MKNLEHYLISDTQGVIDLCEKASKQGVVGMDTEFMREKAYFAELCLLQIEINREYYLVDTLALIKDEIATKLLAELIANPKIIKIIHSCTQDIEVLSQYYNVIPRSIFDTQLAAGFCAYDGQIGYANIVKEVCHVELDKSQTRTNWQQRPLSTKQLEYAVNDVVYLYPLYEKFSAELQERQRQDWFVQESQAMIQSAIDNQKPELAYSRLNGSNMHTKNQHLLVFLANLRELNAQASNKPRPWILKDADLYTIAHAFPSDEEALFSLNISAGFVKRNAAEIVDFIKQIPNSDSAIWANAQPLNSMQKAQVKQISQKLNAISENKGVARSLIANRKDIESYIGGKGAKFEQGWRAEFLGQTLSEIVIN